MHVRYVSSELGSPCVAKRDICSVKSACTPILVRFHVKQLSNASYTSTKTLWILFTIVTQLNDIKRQKVRLEALKKEAEEEREKAREAARERVLLEFEKGQLGLAAPTSISTSGSASGEQGEREST